MNPVVIGRALEWLSRVDRPVEVFLSLAIKLGSLPRLLDLQSLTLAILVGHLLLMVCELGLLNEVLFGIFNWTQDAFVLLDITISHSPDQPVSR